MVLLDQELDLDRLQVVDMDTLLTPQSALDRNIYTPISLRTLRDKHMYPHQLPEHPIHIPSNTCINRRREVILLCVIEGTHMMEQLHRIHTEDQEDQALATALVQLRFLKL